MIVEGRWRYTDARTCTITRIRVELDWDPCALINVWKMPRTGARASRYSLPLAPFIIAADAGILITISRATPATVHGYRPTSVFSLSVPSSKLLTRPTGVVRNVSKIMDRRRLRVYEVVVVVVLFRTCVDHNPVLGHVENRQPIVALPPPTHTRVVYPRRGASPNHFRDVHPS